MLDHEKESFKTEFKSSVIGAILNNIHTNKSNLNLMINFNSKFSKILSAIFSIHLNANIFSLKNFILY